MNKHTQLLILSIISFVLFPVSVLFWYFLYQDTIQQVLQVLALYSLYIIFSSLTLYYFGKMYIKEKELKRLFYILVYVNVLALVCSWFTLSPVINAFVDIYNIIFVMGIFQLLVGLLFIAMSKKTVSDIEAIEGWLLTAGFFKLIPGLALIGFILDYLFLLFIVIRSVLGVRHQKA